MKNRIFIYCLVCMLISIHTIKAQTKGEHMTEDRSVQQAYAELLQSEDNIKAEIESINAMLPSLNSSKSKKASKRLLELDAMYESIQRQKSYYPESVTNTESKPKVEDSAREDIHKIIAEKVQARGGTMEIDESMPKEEDNEQFWSIVIAISSNPDKSKYQAYGDVNMEIMGDKYIFFVGRYDSKSEAEARCKQIIKKGKFREAFVIKKGE